MFNIEEQLKMLPNKPGVYIMHDAEDKIIYVGKAVNLKNRVRSYFRKTDKTERIKRMVSLIDHFEYIVVDNEAEALILECNLIKKNRPKFNVLLKDDKTKVLMMRPLEKSKISAARCNRAADIFSDCISDCIID